MSNFKPPELIYKQEAKFPAAALRARIEGIVMARATVDASGNVENVEIVRPAAPLLDAAALQAVRQWKYKPATRDGLAVPTDLVVTVNFKLH